MRVPRLQYVIEAQEKLDTGVDLRVGDYEVYSSQMRLDLGLLHEGDLVRLLARMHDSVSGLFGVSGCSMTREADPFKQAGDATNVQASCILNFITIRGPERAARAPS